MNPTTPYRLAQGVVIRPERFGALVYRYDNRRLFFLHSQDVADFVTGLDGSRPLDQVVADFVAERGLPASAGDVLFRTMGQLETLEIVDAVHPA